MDWNDTAEQAAFRQNVRDFLAQRLPALYRDHEGRKHESGIENDWQQDLHNGTPDEKAAAQEWADALAERGWGQPHWPKEYGGADMSTLEQFILNQEFARAEAPAIGGNLIGSTLLVHGTEEQKETFLRPTLTGEIRWAQGFSEPGAGSDLGSLQCRATREGDEFVINGQKLWTSAGHKSNWIFGLFRTDPDAPKHRGITFMMIDAASQGVQVRPIISMGWEHATNETFYEDVRVPARPGRGRGQPRLVRRHDAPRLRALRRRPLGLLTQVDERARRLHARKTRRPTAASSSAARLQTATSSPRFWTTSASASPRCMRRATSRTTRPRWARCTAPSWRSASLVPG